MFLVFRALFLQFFNSVNVNCRLYVGPHQMRICANGGQRKKKYIEMYFLNYYYFRMND